MKRPALLLGLALLLIGCSPQADAAQSRSGAQSRSSAPATADAPDASAQQAPSDVPPSRAGDAQPAADYEAALSEILAQIVTERGLVRYDMLKGPLQEKFRQVLKAVETQDAEQLQSHREKLAFWINAYNVQMLQNVLETPGVEDVSAHSEAFFKTPLRTAGHAASLDEIENVILRRQDGPEALEALAADSLDVRLHAGVNCAARSCPPLRTEAYAPGRVDEQLDAAMRAFAASPQHFAVEEGASGTPRFTFNSILEWYGADFDRPGQPAGDTLLRFMSEARPDYATLKGVLEGRSASEIEAQPNVSFAYDWTLNRAE